MRIKGMDVSSRVTDRKHTSRRLANLSKREGASYWLQLASEAQTVGRHEPADQKKAPIVNRAKKIILEQSSQHSLSEAALRPNGIARKLNTKTNVSGLSDPIITSKKKKEMEPKWLDGEKGKAEFADAFKLSATAMLITDEDGLIYGANDAAGKLLAVEAHRLLGKPFVVFVNNASQRSYFKSLRQTALDGSGEMEFQLRLRNGQLKPCRAVLNKLGKTLEKRDRHTGEFLSQEAFIWSLSFIENEFKLNQEAEKLRSALHQREEEVSTLKIETAGLLNSKNEFIAHLTHELRTPLQSIFGASELLNSESLNSQQRELVEVICSAAAQLKAVAESALSLTCIESGKDKVKVSEFNVEPFILDIMAQFRLQVQEKNIGLSFHIDPFVPQRITTDAVRLRQILVNTINNAIKFTSNGSISLKVSLFESSGKILFELTDTGMGMEAQALDNLFQPYTCATGKESRFRGGIGLGLFICKQLIESLGGNISVESEPKRGCKILFVLPCKSHLEPEPAEPPASIPAYATHSSANVLLAEDSDVTAKIVSLQLRQLGCTVTRVADGKQAVAQCAEGDFDIIFMDCQMPVMDGYTAAEKIRELLPDKQIPIIALTGNVGEGEREHCLDTGMSDYMSKPAGVAEFEKVLKVYLPKK